MKTKSRFEVGNVIWVRKFVKGEYVKKPFLVNKIGAWNKFTGYIYELINYNDFSKEYYDDIELRTMVVLKVYKNINEALENEYEE